MSYDIYLPNLMRENDQSVQSFETLESARSAAQEFLSNLGKRYEVRTEDSDNNISVIVISQKAGDSDEGFNYYDKANPEVRYNSLANGIQIFETDDECWEAILARKTQDTLDDCRTVVETVGSIELLFANSIESL